MVFVSEAVIGLEFWATNLQWSYQFPRQILMFLETIAVFYEGGILGEWKRRGSKSKRVDFDLFAKVCAQ